MPTSVDSFRKEYDHCTWIFDLFAHGFDFLNGRFFPGPALEDKWDYEQEAIKRQRIEDQVVAADGAIPALVKRYLDPPGGDAGLQSPEFCLRLFSVLSTIDRVAGDLNYLGAARLQTGSRWANTSEYFERKKQLQQKASGYVVFKPRYFKDRPSKEWLERALKDEEKWKKIPPRGGIPCSLFQECLASLRSRRL